MKEYNIFQAIWMSFYSKKLYQDVATHWGGKAFLYMLVLLALCWVVLTIQMQHSLNSLYRAQGDKLAAQMPVLTIKDGVISTPENHPYVITNPDTNEKLAVIDTTGQYTTTQQANTRLLVTQNTIIMQTDPNETKTYQLSKTVNARIDPNDINGFLKKNLRFAWIFFFIIFLIASYIFRIIQALVYALIGKFFGLIAGVKLSYDQILQIALVAVTPAVILATILNIFNITFPYQYLLYFILAMIYLFFGIKSNKSNA